MRLVDAAGRSLGAMDTSAATGGAYLFAVPRPTAPYVAANDALRAGDIAYRRARRAATARGLSGVEATRAAMRTATRRATFVRPPVVSVLATFAGGRTVRVAGQGRSHEPLPGVAPRAAAPHAPLPRDVPIRVKVFKPGRFATIELSFRAPRAITRFDVHYTSTLHGLTGLRCDQRIGGYNATTGDIAAGQTVRLVMRRRGPGTTGRTAWCPGRFTGEVRYSTPGANFVIGRYAFRVR